MSPPACAVTEPHATYSGETRFPLIVQNFHRYFFYAAVLISLINTWDAIYAHHTQAGDFGFGMGNLILWVNVILLWVYTVSCHSCRSIMGRSEEHTSELQSLMRISYAVFCLKKKITTSRKKD